MTIRQAQIGAAFCAAQLLTAASALGNNITVSNVTLTKNTGSSTATVEFDVAWENSWRVTTGPANYDAAWVFVKFHTGDLNWKSAALDITDTAHVVPASIAAEGGAASLRVGKNDAGTRGMGVFIQRAAAGSGDVAWRNVKLKWNYTDDAVTDSALITLDVHAVEMVYIPQGAFQLGDGVARTGTPAADVASFITAATPAGTAPYTVANANPIPVGSAAGNLTVSGLAAGTYRAVPATFPTGFNAFYLMKYEGSQQQWASFVNTTSKLPAITYTYFESTSNVVQNPDLIEPINGRQDFNSPDLPPHIVGYYLSPLPATGGVPLPAVPTRPIVQAKFPDRAFVSSEAATLAYLDWSGLRPMTEFEYEKAARGTVPPVQGEYAWGTAEVALLSYGAPAVGQLILSEDGTPAEAPANNYNTQGGNAWTRATVLTLTTGIPILGPARVGMFAKETYEPGAPPRIQSGSGYYGNMDLTGNVSELVARWSFPLTTVTVAFSAEHGDGLLGANGLHNVAGWTNAATFFGLRGGSYAEQAVPVSQRSLLTGGSMTNPGIRGARTAPTP